MATVAGPPQAQSPPHDRIAIEPSAPIIRANAAATDAQLQRSHSLPEIQSNEDPTLKSRTEKKIIAAIRNAMKRPDEAEKSFICKRDLEIVCSEPTVHNLFASERWADEQLLAIRKQCLRTLSCLIWIGVSASMERFGEVFFPPGSNLHRAPELNDQCLPILERTKLEFLGHPYVDMFLEKQYCFVPVKIREEYHQNTMFVPKERRLPWGKQSKDIGMGGYGTVRKVTIPSGYLKQQDGAIFTRDKTVACKRIEADIDFMKEVKTLSILKESLTSHENIVQHLATVAHDTRYYILLPLALGDLEMLLRECRGPDSVDRKLNEDIEETFHAMVNKGSPKDFLNQSYLLADAVRWLHFELRVDQEADLYCIHMDLKPGNVLIFDDSSTVGKWKLSDFGISVIKDNPTGSRDTSVLSIGDAYAHLRSRSRPQRIYGTYQAPEVQPKGPNKVGRKSDVWSLACIFSEVLVFSLGRNKLLSEFQTARTCEGDDYFYSALKPNALAPTINSENYIPRPQVVKWLDRLPARCSDQGDWVRCCVRILMNSLIVDVDARPDVRQFRDELQHAFEHVKDSESYKGDKCAILHPQPSPNTTAQDEASIPISPGPLSQTQERLISWQPDLILMPTSRPSQPVRRPSTLSSSSALDQTFDLDISRTITMNYISPSKYRHKHVKDVALSDQGDRAAWLIGHDIHLFEIDSEADLRSRPSLKLRTASWRNVAVSGDFLVAWGHVTASSTRVLYLCDTRKPERKIKIPDQYCGPTLRDIKLSQWGGVLLVSHDRLVLLQLNAESETGISSEMILTAAQAHNFECATFSPSGWSISSWSWGPGPDLFYYWQACNDGRHWSLAIREYESAHYGRPEVSPLAHDYISGCIMRTPANDFFSAHLDEDLSDDTPPSYKQKTTIPNVIIACVFKDRWLVTVEKGSHFRALKRKHQLRRHYIQSEGANRTIESRGHEICRLESNIDAHSKIQAVAQGNDIVVIICNKDGSVERVRLVPD